jgi:hypothetical protein
MAAVVFTTWSDLHAALLNAYADFIANRIQLTEFTLNTGGNVRTFKYQDPDKLLKAIKEVRQMADLESGAAVGRTCAANSGGRWQ